MNIKLLQLITYLFLLISCQHNEDTSEQNTLRRAHQPKLLNDSDGELSNDFENFGTLIENGIELNFNSFAISIDSIAVWTDEKNLKDIKGDTLKLSLEVGEYIEGRTISFTFSDLESLQIYQSYENSIVVSDEGPHCDLIDWKHYNSDWQELPIVNNKCKALSYDVSETEKFIEVKASELKEAIRLNCGDKWYKLVENIETPLDYPCGIGMSKILFKIEYQLNPADGVKTKLIQFEIPMGC